MPKTVFVVAKALVPVEQMDREDTEVAGTYAVLLSDDTPADGLANAALDGFHNTVAVGVLDDFEFVVLTGTGPDAEEIPRNDAYEGYALSQYALSVDCA